MRKKEKMKREHNTSGIQALFLFVGFLCIILLAFGQRLKQTGESEASPTPALLEKELHLMVATDLHYLAPELTDHGYFFTSLIESADGKTMLYCEEVVDVFIITALQKKPDAVILTGDLTFNGEKQSHEQLAKKLTILEEAGIQVLVLSGNHDLNSRNAAKFVGGGYERILGVTEEEFAGLYGAFGFEGAYSRDSASYSYIWECTKELRLLMLDVNGGEVYNTVSKETLRWLEEELKKAKEDGAAVIAFSHQNLLRQSMFSDGYIITNADDVLQLYKEYGVIANFAGHVHIQHIAEQDGFTEVVTSSLQVAPTQYADITWNGQELEYQTSSVDVSSWAKSQGLASKDLNAFAEYAVSFFKRTAYWQAFEALSFCLEDESRVEPLTRYYMDQNYAYFSGRLDLVAADEDLLTEWKNLGAWTAVYLESIAKEERVSQNHVVIKAK